MTLDEFWLRRAEIRALLRRIDELHTGQAARIQFAVRERHGNWDQMLHHTEAERLGRLLISALDDADRDLKPEQVHGLEILAEQTLRDWPPRSPSPSVPR